ncbi:MAG: PAS domain S-box protein [Acidobacteriota bacterium]|nr:PAS domain S-box protein [Acidobacteriota bacterium]
MQSADVNCRTAGDRNALEEFYHQASEGMIFHRDHRILAVNPAASNIFGVSADELIGRGLHEFIEGPEDNFKTDLPRQVTLTNHKGHHLTLRLRTVRGCYEGQNCRLTYVSKSAWLETEKARRLMLAEELWDLYNNNPCGFHVLDRKGLIIQMNDTLLGWLGCRRDDLIGRTLFLDLVCPQSRPVIKRCFAELKRANRKEGVEINLIRADGTRLPAILSATAVRDSEGRFVMCRASVVNISARKQVEIQLCETQEELRRLNQELEGRIAERTRELESTRHELMEAAHQAGMADIASSVLHNVGNILNSVITASHTISKITSGDHLQSMARVNKLLKEVANPSHPKTKQVLDFYELVQELLEKEHDDVVDNNRQVNEQVQLIREVIMAQQSFASAEFQTEELHLEELVEDALKIQAHALQRHHVKVVRDFHKIPLVPVSKFKVIHTLINLVKNAVEAMTDLKTGQRVLTVSILRRGRYVEISITDRGYGIPKENLKAVFTHGFSTKTSGHGFGLHSCANAMAEMGGSIQVESEGFQKGSTFILKFPVKKPRRLP